MLTEGGFDLEALLGLEDPETALFTWRRAEAAVEVGAMPPREGLSRRDRGVLLEHFAQIEAEALRKGGAPGYEPLRRLTRTELQNALRDLLRVTIDLGAEIDLHDAGGHGASASFIGRVRGDDDLVELFLEHHPAMTEAGLGELAHAAADRWKLGALTLIHRVGAMQPGETIVLVLASSRHRAEALAACEFLIDRLKTDVMLWKRETFADGRVAWVEERAGDRDRAGRWAQHP